MSSLSIKTETKRRAKRSKAGRKRKNKFSKKSTLSAKELFAGLGEPEKP